MEGQYIMVRGKHAIILEILTLCKNGASKTKIVYKANLNFKTAGFYLRLLINNGMINTEGGNPQIYQTTLKGMTLIKILSQVDSELIPISSVA